MPELAEREKRLALQLPVEASGEDVRGASFVESTRTINISGRGVCLETRSRLAIGAHVTLAIELPQQLRHHFGDRALYRTRAVVCRVEQLQDERLYRIAARFVGAAPTRPTPRIEAGIVYGDSGGRPLRCDVVAPPASSTRAAAVILIHGGAWRVSDRRQLRSYAELHAAAGLVSIAIEHRTSGEAVWPAQLHDVKAAIRWARTGGSAFGVDPERIAVQGHSSGGHLALMAAGTIGVPELEGDIGSPGVSSAVHSVVAFYAPVDLDRELPPDAPSSLLLGDGAAAQARRAASPLACAASGRFPPTLLIHGTADPIINLDESLAMHSALRRAGVRSELQLFPGRAHDFDAEPRLARECAERIQSFLASSSGEAGNVGGSAGS